MDKSTEILELGLEILQTEQVEWCQGTLYRFDTETGEEAPGAKVIAACAIGALELAAAQILGEHIFGTRDYYSPYPHHYVVYREVVREAERRLENQCPDADIPSFNDDLSTTREDVISMYKRAIYE